MKLLVDVLYNDRLLAIDELSLGQDKSASLNVYQCLQNTLDETLKTVLKNGVELKDEQWSDVVEHYCFARGFQRIAPATGATEEEVHSFPMDIQTINCELGMDYKELFLRLQKEVTDQDRVDLQRSIHRDDVELFRHVARSCPRLVVSNDESLYSSDRRAIGVFTPKDQLDIHEDMEPFVFQLRRPNGMMCPPYRFRDMICKVQPKKIMDVLLWNSVDRYKYASSSDEEESDVENEE